jgi:hypothetical protein
VAGSRDAAARPLRRPGSRRARTRPGSARGPRAARRVVRPGDGPRRRGGAGLRPGRAEALVELLSGAGLVGDAGQDRTPLVGLRPDERERLSADLASLALVRGDGGLPALALRREAQVLVVGAGRVGAPLAVALATAGVGAVDVVDDELTRPQDTGVGGLDLRDVGRPRGRAARELVHRAAPSVSRLPVVRARPRRARVRPRRRP